MDPALLKERELFKKRALSTPAVSNYDVSDAPKKKPKKESITSSVKESSARDTSSSGFSFPKAHNGPSNINFSVLAKIVKYMKQRHLDGDNEPLGIEEILDETNQLDISNRQRTWLVNEALKNNPKIEMNEEGKYVYKPTFALKDRKSLLRLLDKYDQRGLGGIHLEDIQESLPNADKVIRNLGDSILIIQRPVDKKKILFYNDKSLHFDVDEEFQKLWRSVAVDGLDETKIQEYLSKHGITSMQELGGKKFNPVQKRKKAGAKKPRQFKKHNEHMADILQDYSQS